MQGFMQKMSQSPLAQQLIQNGTQYVQNGLQQQPMVQQMAQQLSPMMQNQQLAPVMQNQQLGPVMQNQQLGPVMQNQQMQYPTAQGQMGNGIMQGVQQAQQLPQMMNQMIPQMSQMPQMQQQLQRVVPSINKMSMQFPQNPASLLTSLSAQTGIEITGKTAGQRILSEHRLNGILFRIMMSTMVYMFVMFLIFGIVQAAGVSEARQYQGKIVIVGLSLILGILTSFAVPKIAKQIYPMLRTLVD